MAWRHSTKCDSRTWSDDSNVLNLYREEKTLHARIVMLRRKEKRLSQSLTLVINERNFGMIW